MYRDEQDYSGDLGFTETFARLSWPKRLGIGCLGLIVLWIGVGILLGSGESTSSAGAGLTCSNSEGGIQTCTNDVGFDGCLDTIKRTADELGVAPINIVETSDMRMVRFPASDGSVLVTCSPDGQIGITRSP